MRSFLSIGDRRVGNDTPAYIIAEIGANHNGSFETACEMVRLSAKAGADAVKFQAYTRETLFINNLPDDGSETARKNIELLKRRWEILPSLTAPDDWWPKLKELCDQIGVDFLCTPFDLERLDLLNKLEVKAFKIASGDITWLELLRETGKTGKPVIFSTGASTLGEVESALAAIESSGSQEAAVLHCVSVYPTKWEDGNLKVLESYQRAFEIPVGLSDHSPGSTLPVAAVTLGARIIEKHITLDKTQKGLDHYFAMEMDEFGEMIQAVRNVEAALGSGRKKWVEDERIERYWLRRGLYAKSPIQEGETITREKLYAVRPKHGIGAEELDTVLGKKSTQAFKVGDAIVKDGIV